MKFPFRTTNNKYRMSANETYVLIAWRVSVAIPTKPLNIRITQRANRDITIRDINSDNTDSMIIGRS